jgi:hypothetical protein
MVSLLNRPCERARGVTLVMAEHRLSERHACRLLEVDAGRIGAAETALQASPPSDPSKMFDSEIE